VELFGMGKRSSLPLKNGLTFTYIYLSLKQNWSFKIFEDEFFKLILVRGGSTLVEHSPHHPKVEGSSPAAKKIRLSKYEVLKYGEV
jgi:hypothetical protein